MIGLGQVQVLLVMQHQKLAIVQKLIWILVKKS